MSGNEESEMNEVNDTMKILPGQVFINRNLIKLNNHNRYKSAISGVSELSAAFIPPSL